MDAPSDHAVTPSQSRQRSLSVLSENFRLKVLVVDDDRFTLSLIHDALASRVEVKTATNAADALALLDTFEANVIVSDLDLGDGPDGAMLLRKVALRFPWVGRVVLSTYSSPELAVDRDAMIPDDTVYLVKPRMDSIDDVLTAVMESISGEEITAARTDIDDGPFIVTATQAAVLKLLAQGLSNLAIARELGLSIRATEKVVQRTFATLGVAGDEEISPRVVVARLVNSGQICVR